MNDEDDHVHFEEALKALMATPVGAEAAKRYEEQVKAFKEAGLDESLIDARDILWETYADSAEEKADEEFGDGDPSQWTW